MKLVRGFTLALGFCIIWSSVAMADNVSTRADVTASNDTIANYSPLVSGNGFGFTVVDESGNVSKFYAHPYRFERPIKDVTKDGVSTNNLVKKLSWKKDGMANGAPSLSYVSQSQIISAKNVLSDDLFFMPFGLKQNALIALEHSLEKGRQQTKAAVLELSFEHPLAKEYLKDIGGRPVRIFSFVDVSEQLAVVPLSTNGLSDNHIEKSSVSFSGNGFALLILEKSDDVDVAVKELLDWHGGLSDEALVEREVKSLDNWRKKPPVKFVSEQEHQLWRQSETILRMAQIEEKNRESGLNPRLNHGLILASLPDGIWFTPWVRDMSYSLVALTRMEHISEAREGILSWFNARPVGLWKRDTRGLDYQISVTRYFGDGSEEADYSGMKTENCEFDDWGLALWAISEYWEKTHDQSLLAEKTYRGTVYESMRDFVVKPLLGNLDSCGDGLIVAEDSSCWEEHQENKRHYACSTIAAIPGLKGFLTIAQSMHDDEAVKMVNEKLPLLEKGFKNAFVKDGWVRGVREVDTQPKSEVDGAVLEAFNFGIIRDPSVIEKTIEKMSLLKTASGGYRRNLGPGNYEAHEFLLIDFNLARTYLRLGRKAEASRILQTLVTKSCMDRGLIPEMYVSAKGRDYKGEIGDPSGAIPMVGFGAGDYVITLTDRTKLCQ